VDITGPFHATTDKQAVRNRVFSTLAGIEFRVDATKGERPGSAAGFRRSAARLPHLVSEVRSLPAASA